MADLVAWSAGLFIAGGVVWILIGALTVPMMDTAGGRSTLLFSGPKDTKAFGSTPAQALDDDPNLAKLRTALFRVLAGFLVVAGLMVVALGWLAWRRGEAWAYWTLASVAILVLPFWLLAAKPFLDSGTTIGLGDIPPFMWVTTLLWMPAIALGGWALRGGA